MGIELTTSDISRLFILSIKYTPFFSVDVEHSFSYDKSILRPNQRTFKFENLPMYILSNCFQEDNNKNKQIIFKKIIFN